VRILGKSNQTQQKRQRENKLREKAQLKRELRQQRQAEKKRAQAQEDQPQSEQPVSAESTDANELGLEMTSNDTIITQALDLYQDPAGWTSNQADSEGTPQIGGTMASKLFVGNLARTVTDNDLADFVTNAGFQVASAQVIRDRMTGDPKGFGFVQLAEGTDLQQAIGRLNGQVLQDRPLTVNEARPQRSGFSGSRGGPGFGGRGRAGFGRRRDY
jgi:RNA recognition motif-containing protein